MRRYATVVLGKNSTQNLFFFADWSYNIVTGNITVFVLYLIWLTGSSWVWPLNSNHWPWPWRPRPWPCTQVLVHITALTCSLHCEAVQCWRITTQGGDAAVYQFINSAACNARTHTHTMWRRQPQKNNTQQRLNFTTAVSPYNFIVAITCWRLVTRKLVTSWRQ